MTTHFFNFCPSELTGPVYFRFLVAKLLLLMKNHSEILSSIFFRKHACMVLVRGETLKKIKLVGRFHKKKKCLYTVISWWASRQKYLLSFAHQQYLFYLWNLLNSLILEVHSSFFELSKSLNVRICKNLNFFCTIILVLHTTKSLAGICWLIQIKLGFFQWLYVSATFRNFLVIDN